MSTITNTTKKNKKFVLTDEQINLLKKEFNNQIEQEIKTWKENEKAYYEKIRNEEKIEELQNKLREEQTRQIEIVKYKEQELLNKQKEMEAKLLADIELAKAKQTMEFETKKSQDEIKELRRQLELQHTQEVEFTNKLAEELDLLRTEVQNQKIQNQEFMKEKNKEVEDLTQKLINQTQELEMMKNLQMEKDMEKEMRFNLYKERLNKIAKTQEIYLTSLQNPYKRRK